MSTRIAFALLFFAGFEGLLFHTTLYSSIIEPDSTTGGAELRMRTELGRSKGDHNQVLAFGNSRMGFLPRIANEETPKTGYVFASVATPGTNARCWYYMDRCVDPDGNGYQALLIPANDYDELDQAEIPEERELDLHYLLARLELRDLFEFAGSYGERWTKWTAFRGILLKGFVYKRDFQEFLLHPRERLVKAQEYNLHWGTWAYDFPGDEGSLAGLEIDWPHRTAQYPGALTASERELIENTLLATPPPDTGRYTAYFRYWYGKILDRHRGSDTKIIFLRLPRGPLHPPEHPVKLNSAVRQLGSQRNVILLDEHLFDSLERPELFHDALHLNRPGMEQFSRMLATEVARVLGPPGH